MIAVNADVKAETLAFLPTVNVAESIEHFPVGGRRLVRQMQLFAVRGPDHPAQINRSKSMPDPA